MSVRGRALGAHEKQAVEAPAASLRATPPVAAERADALTALAIPPLELKAPWHVRHARKILYAVASVASAGVAYFSYYAWSLHTDPLDRSIAARWRADRSPAPTGTPPATPIHQAVTGVVAVPATSANASAPPRGPQQRPIRTKPVEAAVLSEGARQAPALSRAHPVVTHTRPNDPASADAAAPARARGPDRSSSPGGTRCSTEVAALGLCNPGTRQEGG